MLIHCAWGSERTGLVSAFAELLRPGSTLDDARAQFSLGYLFVRLGDGKVMAEHLDQYESWLLAAEARRTTRQTSAAGSTRDSSRACPIANSGPTTPIPGRDHPPGAEPEVRPPSESTGHGSSADQTRQYDAAIVIRRRDRS